MSRVIDWQARSEAIDIHGSFCVVAPAGSGKTELLTQRLLALLAHVNYPEEILAITFTRKAAAEMQDRVIEAMHNAMQPEPPNLAEHARLTRHLALAVIERDKALSWHLLQSPSRLRIKTIDGFCASVTQQLPMSARLGAQMGVADDPEALYSQAVQDMLKEFLAKPECRPSLAIVLSLLENRLDKFESMFVGLLKRRDQWLTWILNARQAAHDNDLYHQLLDDIALFNRIRIQNLKRSIAPFASSLAMLLDFAGKNAPQGNEKISQLKGLRDLPSDEPSDFELWQIIFDVLFTQKNDLRKKITANEGFPAPSSEKDKDLKSLFKARKDQLSELLSEIQADEELMQALLQARILVPAQMADNDYQILSALLDLMPIAVAYLHYTFATEGCVDYIEINQAANQALGDDENPTDLALRLDYQIKHILLDEFQDTSFPQLELLRKLTNGWQQGDGRSLFIVGDGMQSCYGFRDANVGIFLNAREHGIGQIPLKNLQLEANFRSQQGIVDWINQAFSDAFPKRDDAQLGAVKFSLATAVKPKLDLPAVSCHAFTGDNPRVDEANYVVEQIKLAKSRAPDDSIAVLVRSRNHLKHLLPALQQNNIPWIAEDIDALKHRSFIKDLINLYCAVVFPAEDLAWIALLRSPLFGFTLKDLLVLKNQQQSYTHLLITRAYRELAFSDDALARLESLAKAVQAFWQQRQRKPIATALQHLWLDLQGKQVVLKELLPHTADSDIENFFTQLELLASSSPGFLPTREDIEHAIDKLFASVDSSQANAVHLMTIHKSKGLEFDTVIIPCLDRGTVSNDKPLVMWQAVAFPGNREGLLLAPLNDSDKDSERLYELLRIEQLRKERLESVRLLYVGATRAIKHLHLTACLSTSDSDQIKPPTDGALLSGIWPTFETNMEVHQSTTYQNAKNLSQINWRLSSVAKCPDLDLWQPGDGAKNLPNIEEVSFAQKLGVLFHSVCEFIAGAASINWSNANYQQQMAVITQHMRTLGIIDSSLVLHEKCHQLIQNTLSDQHGQWLLSEHPTQHNEWVIIDEFGKQYVIDRFFIDDNGQGYIVDYKTSAPEEGETLENFVKREVEHYTPQLRLYQALLAKLGFNAIAGIYFPAISRWQTLS